MILYNITIIAMVDAFVVSIMSLNELDLHIHNEYLNVTYTPAKVAYNRVIRRTSLILSTCIFSIRHILCSCQNLHKPPLTGAVF